ncbi:MAG: hypothetical protein IJ618_04230 [Prevotella sp.]|nr:hypothetical protein [Prevotella sp.]
MTTKLKNIRRIVAASALLMLLGLVSCTNEVVTSHSSDSAKGEARQVRFALNTGGQAKTRATASSASEVAAQKRENIITKLYAVVFTPDATNQLTAGSFSKTYEVALTDMATLNADVANANQTYSEATFTMDEAGLYYMFLVANPGEALEKNLTNATGATNALTTAKTVTDFYGLVESDRNPNDNSATGFLMTSKMIQVDIKGDEETDLTGTDISLTRAAARFDIDASALGNDFVLTSVKFKNRHATTVVVNTGTDATETGTSSTSTTDPTYNKPASLPAATASMPADPATFLSAYVWKGGIYGYENHADAQDNVDGGSEANAGDGITQLIISGTYKGIAVSQTVDFWSMEEVAGNPGDPVTYTYTTIPINRNTIYTVKLLPKATPDLYAPFAYTIGVANWREGETIVYKGEKLAEPSAPELVSIKRQLWDETNNEWKDAVALNLSDVSLSTVDDNGDPTTVTGKKTVIKINTCRLAIKVRTGTSGCNIKCDELGETLTGASASYLDPTVATLKGDVKGFIENASTPVRTYDDEIGDGENGTMYQTWYVQISGDNIKGQKFNFSLINQLNSTLAYRQSFQVLVNPYEGIAIGDLIYQDGTWSTAADRSSAEFASKTPVAIVFATSNEITMPDYDIQKHHFNGYAMALKESSSVGTQWSTNTLTSLITDASIHPSAIAAGDNVSDVFDDLSGLEHCAKIQEKIDAGTYSINDLPAYKSATEFKVVVGETLTETTSGWFLPSIGQTFLWYVATGNTLATRTNWIISQYPPCISWRNVVSHFSSYINNWLSDKLVTTAGLTSSSYDPFVQYNGYWSSSERTVNYTWSFADHNGNYDSLDGGFESTKTYGGGASYLLKVRPIIAL